jgi:hypothetical protein
MEDYDSVNIIPTLHRNNINFIGMLNRSEYIISKKINDKFIVVDRKNNIQTWSIITGKLLTQYKLEGYDFTTYDIFASDPSDNSYKRGWYNSISLLINKTPIEDFGDDQFYDANMLKTSLENNTSFIKQQKKKFHKFKVVEIINEREIKEHFTFTHQFAFGGEN